VSFIDQHREGFVVEPICQTLPVAPSTDTKLKVEISRVHKENFNVYGTEKVWRQIKREGIEVGRDRMARLMAAPSKTRLLRMSSAWSVIRSLLVSSARACRRRGSSRLGK
jgi:hypothetical protein